MTDGASLRNNHNTSGAAGGVLVANGADFRMEGGQIAANAAAGDGGGVVLSGGAALTLTGGSISGNKAAGKGGGVVLETGGGLNMSGGGLSGNRASGGGEGVFVAAGAGSFTLSGAAAVDTDNDVYLTIGKFITVGSASLGSDPAARITPSSYKNGVIILSGSVSGNYQKFTLTQDGANSWHANSYGYLTPGP
jgi:hypothetical protein